MLKVLEAHNLNTASVNRAVTEVSNLSDAALEKLVWDATGGMVVAEAHNLLVAAKQAVNAIINLGTNATEEKVAAHIEKRIKLVPKPVAAPVAVAAVVESDTGVTATEVEDTTVQATPPSMASLVTESVTTTAKRGRGRPKQAVTDYDRAVAVIKASGVTGSSELTALLVASGFKKNSAAVYVWRYGKAATPTP